MPLTLGRWPTPEHRARHLPAQCLARTSARLLGRWGPVQRLRVGLAKGVSSVGEGVRDRQMLSPTPEWTLSLWFPLTPLEETPSPALLRNTTPPHFLQSQSWKTLRTQTSPFCPPICREMEAQMGLPYWTSQARTGAQHPVPPPSSFYSPGSISLHLSSTPLSPSTVESGPLLPPWS